GMYVYTDVNGDYYIAETEDSVQRFSLGRIVVYDANKRQSLGSMTVETVKDGQLYLLTVSADESFLLDSKTVYPVTIDPSITVSESTAGTNIEDAPVFANKADMNFGAFTYNNIGQENTNYGNAKTAVKLTGLANNSVYKTLNASEVTSVLLYVKEAPYFSAKHVNLYRISSVPSWTESTVTWNNVGSYSTSGVVKGSLSTCDWSNFDITTFVNGWKNGN
ncbi:MAG: DNRLRE domain-containing protein, partial [Clostridia bacterium]|nr:DNRLRE domain-containing protein [Clostridia bacterium]